jgi:hypothetical protein
VDRSWAWPATAKRQSEKEQSGPLELGAAPAIAKERDI